MVAFIGFDGYVSTVGKYYYPEGGVVHPAIWFIAIAIFCLYLSAYSHLHLRKRVLSK